MGQASLVVLISIGCWRCVLVWVWLGVDLFVLLFCCERLVVRFIALLLAAWMDVSL